MSSLEISTLEASKLGFSDLSSRSPPSRATMTLPKTYKQAAFKSQGADLTVEDVELQLPGPGEVLVKVEACGVCFSDMFAQHNVMGGGL